MENRNTGKVANAMPVILSHKRATTMCTHLHIADAILCVPESQGDEYAKVIDGTKIFCHPDSIVGLSAKMQWVLDAYHSVFFLDDNINGCYSTQSGEKLSPEDAYQVIQQAANACHQMGKYMFGFSQYPNTTHFNPLQPVKLTGFIPGQALGLLGGSGLKINEKLIAHQDYYLSCMNAHFHRQVYKDMRYHFRQANKGPMAGGQSEFRNTITDEKDLLLLRKLFGDTIRITESQKGNRKYKITLKIPL